RRVRCLRSARDRGRVGYVTVGPGHRVPPASSRHARPGGFGWGYSVLGTAAMVGPSGQEYPAREGEALTSAGTSAAGNRAPLVLHTVAIAARTFARATPCSAGVAPCHIQLRDTLSFQCVHPADAPPGRTASRSLLAVKGP